MSQKPTGRYGTAIRNEAMHLFVEEEWTLQEISAHFDGRPRVSTLGNWKNKPDKAGKTWDDYKREAQERKYVQMSPDGMANKILDKIWRMLNDDTINSVKLADALSKMQWSVSSLMSPKHQIPTMFKMLEDLVVFVKPHHPSVFVEEFKEAVLGFKNQLRGRLEYGSELTLTERVGDGAAEGPN